MSIFSDMIQQKRRDILEKEAMYRRIRDGWGDWCETLRQAMGLTQEEVEIAHEQGFDWAFDDPRFFLSTDVDQDGKCIIKAFPAYAYSPYYPEGRNYEDFPFWTDGLPCVSERGQEYILSKISEFRKGEEV
jgi:hypothetical protein